MSTASQEMRAKIIEFIESHGAGATVDRCKIKDHVGLEPFAYSKVFETALKSTRLEPIYERNEIRAGERFIGYTRPYVTAFKIRTHRASGAI